MKPPEIITSNSGVRCLVVYYNGDNYDQAIDTAERQLGVAGEKIGVLALPIKHGGFYEKENRQTTKVQITR